MIRVSNKACVRHLGRQSMKAAKTRNCIAVLAIALTTVLFTSLFTIALSINDGFQQSNFRQAGGYNHATFKSLTQEQFGEIKEDPLIKEWGLRRFIGMPTEAPLSQEPCGDRLLRPNPGQVDVLPAPGGTPSPGGHQ